MAIGPKVEADLKTALKARDELAISCLRLVRAALKNKEKELRRELSEAEELQVLNTLAKQRREAAEQFRQGGRAELAEKEERELALIQGYLPEQLDQAGIEKVLDQVFAELTPQGMKDMGRVMKAAMTRLQGQADGKLVNQLVRKRLGA